MLNIVLLFACSLSQPTNQPSPASTVASKGGAEHVGGGGLYRCGNRIVVVYSQLTSFIIPYSRSRLKCHVPLCDNHCPSNRRSSQATTRYGREVKLLRQMLIFRGNREISQFDDVGDARWLRARANLGLVRSGPSGVAADYPFDDWY